MRYAHTNIISQDWESLADFYIKVFGCQLVPPQRDQSGQWLDKGIGVKNAHLKGVHLLLPGHGINGPTLEIYSYQDIEPLEPVNPNTRGIGHLAFEVEDINRVLASIIEHGGAKNGQISSRSVEGVGKITFIYTRDPDGNLIEIQHWDKE